MDFFQSNFDGNKIAYAIGGEITIRDIIRSENILTKNLPKSTDNRIWVDYDCSELYIGEYTSVKKGKGIQKWNFKGDKIWESCGFAHLSRIKEGPGFNDLYVYTSSGQTDIVLRESGEVSNTYSSCTVYGPNEMIRYLGREVIELRIMDIVKRFHYPSFSVVSFACSHDEVVIGSPEGHLFYYRYVDCDIKETVIENSGWFNIPCQVYCSARDAFYCVAVDFGEHKKCCLMKFNRDNKKMECVSEDIGRGYPAGFSGNGMYIFKYKGEIYSTEDGRLCDKYM